MNEIRNRLGKLGVSLPECNCWDISEEAIAWWEWYCAERRSSEPGFSLDVKIKMCSEIQGESRIYEGCRIQGRIDDSILGPETRIEDHGIVEQSVCVPFDRSVSGKTVRFPVRVVRGRVAGSVVWGGADVRDGACLRGACIAGPFVHIGLGSELKASYVRGVSTTASVEIPHRSYLGNATAISLTTGAPWSDPLHFTRLKNDLPAVFQGEEIETERIDWGEGAFHVPEKIRMKVGDSNRTITAEGVNLGALFTTSNFDPRRGGTKWPTNIQGGAKAGILTMIQAPANLPQGALLASGSKAAGDNYPPYSVILGGVSHALLPGYLAGEEILLSRDVKENLDITLRYIRQLGVFKEVARILAGSSRGWRNDAFVEEQEVLTKQAGEIAGFVKRYLYLTERSVETMRKKEKAGKLAGKQKKRFAEQSEILASREKILNDLEAILR